MTVFKLYWKVFRNNIVSVIIYISVFIALVMITMQSYEETRFSFEIVKTEIAFVDEDDTELTRGLKAYLGKYAVFKDIEENKIEDALFYHDISLYVAIPEGFTEGLKEGEVLPIKTKSVPQAYGTHLITQIVQKYAHLAYVYMHNDLENENLVSVLQEKLDQEAVVSEMEHEVRNLHRAQYYYNYMAYLLLALIISVISSIMLAFKPLEIKRRNLLGAMSNSRLNLILLLCNFLLGLALLVLLIILSFILYPEQMLNANGFLFIVNAFVFTFPVIALSYLIVTLFDSRNVVTAIGTVFSLGFSFITGVFIPQFLIDKSILVIAKGIPSYYYVWNNNKIVEISSIDFISLKPILNNFLIQFGFALLFIAIAVFVARKRATQES